MRSIFLLALMSIGTLIGFQLFSALFEQRDGIHMHFVMRQHQGAVLGAFCGIIAEVLIQRVVAGSFRFSLKELLLYIAVIAAVLRVAITLRS